LIKLFFIDGKAWKQIYSVDDLLQRIPEHTHERALRYRFEKDQYNYIFGRLLLLKALDAFSIDEMMLMDIKHNDFGKPLLEELHFNISHSGHFVIIAASAKCEVGIDVEVEGSIQSIDDLNSYFTKVEWQDIKTHQNSLLRLYEYWTAKESVLKAEGTGVSRLDEMELIPFSRANFKGEEKIWYLKPIDFGEKIICTLCADQPIQSIEMEEYIL